MSAENIGEADFEYDEGMGEAGDSEGDESYGASEGTDEADEGADERASEADEAADEAADESDTLGGHMEADEADEGSDEADEAVDEAYEMSAAARLRASEDRNRRATWARRLAADQRMEAQRAATAQRAIADRIRAIPITSRTRIASVGALQGAGVVTAILPNGRRTRMRIVPTVAPISEVNRLRSVVLANERRQAAAIATNARAVTSLAAAQSTSTKKAMAQQIKSDAELSRRVVEGDNRLDARITKELSGGSGILEKHSKRMISVLKRERRRAMMNNVLLATSTPFFLAYGDRESPFTKDNAIITGSTLFWLLGDDLISAWSANKGFMQGLASVWSYGAPLANGGGLYWWFRNKQNQRFIAGISPVLYTGTETEGIDVPGMIKKDGVADFIAAGHSVVASFADNSSSGTVRARLDKTTGKLYLSIDNGKSVGSPLTSTANVAWIVDTKAPTKAVGA
jgi:hypothetical protein